MINDILTGISPYLWDILGVVFTAVASYIGLKLKTLYENKINTETKEKIVKAVVEIHELHFRARLISSPFFCAFFCVFLKPI